MLITEPNYMLKTKILPILLKNPLFHIKENNIFTKKNC